MKVKLLILVICAYGISFAVNVIPSLKYPDTQLYMYQLLPAALVVLLLTALIMKGSYNSRLYGRIKGFLFIGFISGIFVFAVKQFEHSMIDSFLFDMISSMQYPFYLIFTTPLFGLNLLFDFPYETFSLLIGALYLFAFCFLLMLKKRTLIRE